MGYMPPLQLTITIPQQRQTQYGVHSTLHHTAGKIFMRTSAEEKEIIEKWAKELHITLSQFCRDVCLQAARQLEKHKELYNADHQPNRSG